MVKRCFAPVKFERVEQCLEQKHVQLVSIPKGDTLLQMGSVCRSVDLVLQGIQRQYSIAKGEKVSFMFYQEGQFSLDYHSFLSQKESQYSIEAIEDSLVLRFDREPLLHLQTQEIPFKDLLINILAASIQHLYYHKDLLLTQTPEERYKKLRTDHHYLLDRVPLSKIASFIGVTVPSLSRIRRRLSDQE